MTILYVASAEQLESLLSQVHKLDTDTYVVEAKEIVEAWVRMIKSEPEPSKVSNDET